MSTKEYIKVEPINKAGAVLAFDFGEKRIGVAVGESRLALAHPLTTLQVESNADRMAAIEILIKEWQPIRLVIGQPQHADGSEHPVAHLAKKFANRLKERFGIAVEYIDESLSSDEAARRLREQGVSGLEGKAHIDQLAAQVILQAYFDERTNHALAS